MTKLFLLNARLDAALIEFDRHCHMDRGAGRINNPLYDPEVNSAGCFRKLDGEGETIAVPLSQVVSTQRTVHYSKVRKMATKIGRGDAGDAPTAIFSDGKYILTDGNHRAAGHVRAGKRKIKIRVQ